MSDITGKCLDDSDKSRDQQLHEQNSALPAESHASADSLQQNNRALPEDTELPSIETNMTPSEHRELRVANDQVQHDNCELQTGVLEHRMTLISEPIAQAENAVKQNVIPAVTVPVPVLAVTEPPVHWARDVPVPIPVKTGRNFVPRAQLLSQLVLVLFTILAGSGTAATGDGGGDKKPLMEKSPVAEVKTVERKTREISNLRRPAVKIRTWESEQGPKPPWWEGHVPLQFYRFAWCLARGQPPGKFHVSILLWSDTCRRAWGQPVHPGYQIA
jgi:hypothetical protein